MKQHRECTGCIRWMNQAGREGIFIAHCSLQPENWTAEVLGPARADRKPVGLWRWLPSSRREQCHFSGWFKIRHTNAQQPKPSALLSNIHQKKNVNIKTRFEKNPPPAPPQPPTPHTPASPDSMRLPAFTCFAKSHQTVRKLPSPSGSTGVTKCSSANSLSIDLKCEIAPNCSKQLSKFAMPGRFFG